MNNTAYFIHLLSSHLNSERPDPCNNIDWQEIFSLAEKHCVNAIIMQQIKLLPPEFRPSGKVLSKFNQWLGYTIKRYEMTMKALSRLISVLTEAEIPHILVKGSVLRFIYPTPELRTSGDTDVIISPSNYKKAISVLRDNGFTVENIKLNFAVLTLDDDNFEIHTELESINVQSKIYFSTPFEDISECVNLTYKLKPMYHLLYVITHIAHHLQTGGAGIRMIMDIDVLLRSYGNEIDMNEFMEICDNIRLKRTAEALIALSKKWFRTPVSIDYTFEDSDEKDFYKLLTGIIINGGIFGKANGGAGMVYTMKNINKHGKADLGSSIKAFFRWIFPAPSYLKRVFTYADSFPFLVPVAWFHRLVKALFHNLKIDINIVKGIFTKREMSQKQYQLLEELQINNNE